LASAAVWAGWLGWDHEYQVDPVSRTSSGPYEPWQVMGAGLCLVTVLVVALVAGLPPVPASGALTLGFTAAWTVDAAWEDASGLFLVGTIMLLAGLTIACTVVSAITLVTLRRVRSTPGGPAR
jgi:hypothetical protein